MHPHLQALNQALEHQMAGRLPEAEIIYREILQQDPENVDALHLMGMLAYQGRNYDLAAHYIGKAIQRDPEQAMFHNNLGIVIRDMGRPEKSLLCYEHALRLQPKLVEAHVNLGNALQDLDRPEEAISRYRQAIRLAPKRAEIYGNLGNAQVTLGQVDEGIANIRKALRLNPRLADGWVSLASALYIREKFEEALEACQEALRLNPYIPEAHSNLGAILIELDRLDEAETHLQEAISLKPESAKAHFHLANVLARRGQLPQAEAYAREAIERSPNSPEALHAMARVLWLQGRVEEAEGFARASLERNRDQADVWLTLGNVLVDQARTAESETCFAEVIRLRPHLAGGHWNRALALLTLGRFEEGWREYEWRWKRRESPGPTFQQPQWDGAPLKGRTILLLGEQGLGDTIQFIRYAPQVQQLGGRVALVCNPALVRLLGTARGIDEIVSTDSTLPSFDTYSALLSLPRLFGTTPQTIPAGTPYLAADPAASESWRQRLSGGKPKVGLVWAGSPLNKKDAERSLRLEQFAPLGTLTGISFFSLQKGPRAAELENAPGGLQLTDLEANNRDMADSAAAIMNLDLVISADTSVAHLTGALGKPVWVLAPFTPDWRWMLGREDSPWYPTARLFRQTSRGDWAGVMERVREALVGHFA